MIGGMPLKELGLMSSMCEEIAAWIEAKTDGDPHPFRAHVRCIEGLTFKDRDFVLIGWKGGRFWFPVEYIHGDSPVKIVGDSGILLVKKVWAVRNEWW